MSDEPPVPLLVEEPDAIPTVPIDDQESSKAQRWEIWGRWMGGREFMIVPVESRSRRHLEFSDLRLLFSDNWDLWLESFPVEHPHRALQRRLHGNHCSPKTRLTLRLEKSEGVPTRTGRPRTGPVV